MTNIGQGWQAYHRGQFEQSLAQFNGGNGEAAVAGMALSLVAMGRSQEAMAQLQRHLQQSPSAATKALLADILGRQGSRAEAERMLVNTTARNQENGFYRSLLGEQRIRQGKWDQGTEDFIAALNMRSTRAFPHVQRVIADMVDAVAARRIPKADGMRFVNRIDYSIANKTPEMNSFFATARRSINGNRRMERSHMMEPWSLVTGVASAPAAASPQQRPTSPAPQQRPTSPAPQQRPTSPAPQQRSTSPARQQRSTSPTPQRPSVESTRSPAQQRRASNAARSQRRQDHQPAPARNDMQERLARRQVQTPREPIMEANLKDMTAILRQERTQNESLQNLVADIDPPIWPSQWETPIDTIPPIGFTHHTVFPGSGSLDSTAFRLTGGDIRVQITLERCMHNLMAAAHSVKPTPLPLIPASIARVGLNLLDNFIDEMPDLSSLYREEITVENPKMLGLGKFIGECIVQTFGGVWQYAEPPEDSRVHLGTHTLDPMGLAKSFLDEPSFDSVSLRALVNEAEEAMKTSTFLATFVDHIDPTPGLEKEALRMSLAGLWVNYRFVLAETAIQPIAASMELLDAGPSSGFIPFAIGVDFVPPVVEAVDGSTDTSRRARMAYVRKNGEFLLLASRKHFQRVLAITGLDLTEESAHQFIAWIQQYFRPGWTIMSSQKVTQSLHEKLGNEALEPPQFRRQGRGAELHVDALTTEGQHRRIRLRYQPDDHLSPFELLIGG